MRGSCQKRESPSNHHISSHLPNPHHPTIPNHASVMRYCTPILMGPLNMFKSTSGIRLSIGCEYEGILSEEGIITLTIKLTPTLITLTLALSSSSMFLRLGLGLGCWFVQADNFMCNFDGKGFKQLFLNVNIISQI